MHLLLRVAPLHVAAAAFFGWSAARLYAEASRLGGWQRGTELALAAASAALALLSARALLGLVLTAPRISLRGRRAMGDYLVALAAAVALVVAGQRAWPGRLALSAFCVGLAAWIVAVTFDLLPRLMIGERRVVDTLGRTVAFARLEWFRASPGERRAWLQLGSAERVRVAARVLSVDLADARAALKKAGLRDRS